MDTEYQSEIESKYVWIKCRGTLDIDEMLDVWDRAFQFATKEDRKAILVDIRGLTGRPFTTMDRFNIAEHIVALQRSYGMRIAVALLGDEPMIDSQKFAETVARNRGAIGRVFTDFNEAVDWLGKKAAAAAAR